MLPGVHIEYQYIPEDIYNQSCLVCPRMYRHVDKDTTNTRCTPTHT